MRVVRHVLTLTLFALVGSLAVYAGQRPQMSRTRLTYVGTTNPHRSAALQSTSRGNEVMTGPEVDMNFTKPLVPGSVAPARVPASFVPKVPGNAISTGSFSGLAGITHKQQHDSEPRANARNFSLEPPDQGLAVGNGFIVEAVNTAIAIYNTTDASSTPGAPTPIAIDSLNDFFGLDPSITEDPDTHALTFGPFISDPRVYFDGATSRFFVTVLDITLDPTTEAFEAPTYELIAVSQTSDPTGSWNIFSLEVTNDNDSALNSRAPCPCFGDQPLLGADANGFYIDTNAFSLVTGYFGGNQLYAISKSQLEAGTASTATRIHDLTEAEGFAFSLQPAIVPPDGTFDTDNNGTEFFVGSLDFTGTLDDRLAVWALTNTSSLDTTPALTLSEAIITTEVYGQPPSAQQKPGPTPLLDLLFDASRVKNHLELVASNDDRMQQVSYADGKLWTSLNTVIQTPEGPVRTGGAYFILTPSVSGSGGGTQVDATVFNQGYVAINSSLQDSVEYPAIAVNGSGAAIIGFSIVGQDFYPSAAYTALDENGKAGDIIISGPGTAPDDGFSGYAFSNFRPFPFGVGRWGDYGAGTGDESGNLWLGGEMIPNAPRTTFANWGTFVTEVVP
jgi:hypothetical protein